MNASTLSVVLVPVRVTTQNSPTAADPPSSISAWSVALRICFALFSPKPASALNASAEL